MQKFYSKYKTPIGIIIIFILFGGAFALNKMQTGLFPDITFPKIKIIAESGQQPIEKMMVTVTVPLENAIKKTQNLKLLKSTTSRGDCEISAFLDWNSDIDLGLQRIEAQINSIKQDLPPNTNITVEKMNPSILPVMGYSLEGKGKSPIELRQLAEFVVKPFLSRIEGISDIAVIGGKQKEYHIIIDPVKVSSLGLTVQNIGAILSQNNFITSNGYMTDYNRMYLSITNTSVNTIDELKKVIIKNTPQRAVLLQDVADVQIAEKKEYVKINANGLDVPLVAVLKQPNANLVVLSKEVESKVAELNKTLPHGVQLKPYYKQADFVNDSVSSLIDVLWIGLLLAIVVTIIFLRSTKASLIILITIPTTLSLTMVCLYAFGYTLNIMTIGAIAAAIGLIIDDAIVVVEQIHRTHEEYPDEKSFKLVNDAIKYLFPSMIGSSLSTIVIFLPFVLMSGVAGAYFKVMTNTMIITLICSFFVTWICLPVIYILFSKDKESKIKGKELKNRKWINYFVQRPIISIVFVIALILTLIFIIPVLPSGFLPDMDEGSIVLDFDSPPGTSLEASDDMLKKVDDILNKNENVESFSRRLGTQMGFFITEPNRGDYLIQLKKHRSETTEEVSNDIRTKIESTLPSLQIDFGQVIGDMLGDLMSSSQPVEVKIFGDDTKRLQELSDKVADVVSNVKGTADVFNGITIAGPELNIAPDIAKLAQFNLSPSDFQYNVQNKIEGNIVGSAIENNHQVDIVMFEKSNPNEYSINDLSNSSIFLPNGSLKQLKDFATLKLNKGVAEVDRENLKPMVAVTARLNNRDLGSTLKELKTKIQESVTLPPGYTIEYGGAYSEQQKAFDELLIILISSAFLVFVVILILYRNIKVSLLIISLAVLGAAGSALALLLTNTPLNVGSYTGIIMIVGIIGENAIFTYQQYQKEKEVSDIDNAISFAISTRLRPKLMTALGAIAALFPLSLGIGTGAQMHQPLAIAIIGGLIIALPLLLIVLPTFLKIIEKEEPKGFIEE